MIPNSMNEINTPNPPPAQQTDLNLKVIIYKGLEYVRLIWKNKLWVILFALLGTGAYYVKSYLTPVQYVARLTFSLNEGEKSNTGLSGVLGQFGLGGNTSGKFSMEKIVELSKSMRIVREVLFEQADIGGKKDFLINHILDQYDMEEQWAKNTPAYKDFRFISDSFEQFSILENAALKGIYWFVIGGFKPGLLVCTYNDETTLFSILVTSENEQLSLELAQQIFSHLSKFYVQQSNDKQQNTYNLLKHKSDSLYRKWIGSEYSISNLDQSQGALWSPVDRTRKTIQGKQTAIYGAAYGEALRNLEMADYALKSSTPFFGEIDGPFYPLDAIAPNYIINMIKGFILGAALCIAFILGNYFIKNALNS